MNRMNEVLSRVAAVMISAIMLLAAVTFGAMAAEMETTEKGKTPYAVIVQPSEGGSLTLVEDDKEVVIDNREETVLSYSAGNMLRFTVSAEDGYEYSGTQVTTGDNVPQASFGPDEEVVFEMQEHDVRITASFIHIQESSEKESDGEQTAEADAVLSTDEPAEPDESPEDSMTEETVFEY